MKKPAKTAGIQKKNADTKESQVHPIVRWWPIQTPRLMGERFENPVSEIPTVNSPIRQRTTEG
jgi:hypothetical protein